ncbi:MAG TPA: hypothetical protein DEQ86_00475 [Candidatus Jacksonbacteria bacterium]|nr:hypothetical protein [Candidatus Jacksonbacteria bacterium]
MFKKKVAGQVILNNKPLSCLVCGHDKFFKTSVSSNQQILAWFGWEMFSKSGAAYDCEMCGFRHTFFK